jgi:hypothetical protein
MNNQVSGGEGLPERLSAAVDKLVITNATGNERLFMAAANELLPLVREAVEALNTRHSAKAAEGGLGKVLALADKLDFAIEQVAIRSDAIGEYEWYTAEGLAGMHNIGNEAGFDADGIYIALCSPANLHVLTSFVKQHAARIVGVEDSARLNWMESAKHSAFGMEGGGFDVVRYDENNCERWVASGTTLRTAIDAAMVAARAGES